MSSASIDGERSRRLSLWAELATAGTGRGVTPARIREVGLWPGRYQRGIWYDKKTTASVDPAGNGITVSVLHTGVHYPDDLSDDGIIYHYPVTKLPSHDQSEVSATKTAERYQLPIFVITKPSASAKARDVFLGWVVGSDDRSEQFLILFGDAPPVAPVPLTKDHFELKTRRRRSPGQRSTPSRDPRFSFLVFQRYGPRCAVCDIAVRDVLDAAHLCPVDDGGSDDARNGLVLCATHHRAFDAKLFCFDPASLDIRYSSSGPSQDELRITRHGVSHLDQHPHSDALEWCWERFRR